MIQLQDLVIDLDRRLLTRDGRPISLTRTEWLLQHELALNSGRVLLHAELLSRIWGPEYVNDYQYLRVWLSRLRSKLGGGRSLIKTLEGIGYVFDPEGQFPEGSQQKAALKPQEKGPGLTRPA